MSRLVTTEERQLFFHFRSGPDRPLPASYSEAERHQM